MPKSLDEKESLPLPYNWEKRQDYDGKTYFIDHTKKITTWIDPRDRQVSNIRDQTGKVAQICGGNGGNCVKTCKIDEAFRVWPNILRKISRRYIIKVNKNSYIKITFSVNSLSQAARTAAISACIARPLNVLVFFNIFERKKNSVLNEKKLFTESLNQIRWL